VISKVRIGCTSSYNIQPKGSILQGQRGGNWVDIHDFEVPNHHSGTSSFDEIIVPGDNRAGFSSVRVFFKERWGNSGGDYMLIASLKLMGKTLQDIESATASWVPGLRMTTPQGLVHLKATPQKDYVEGKVKVGKKGSMTYRAKLVEDDKMEFTCAFVDRNSFSRKEEHVFNATRMPFLDLESYGEMHLKLDEDGRMVSKLKLANHDVFGSLTYASRANAGDLHKYPLVLGRKGDTWKIGRVGLWQQSESTAMMYTSSARGLFENVIPPATDWKPYFTTTKTGGEMPAPALVHSKTQSPTWLRHAKEQAVKRWKAQLAVSTLPRPLQEPPKIFSAEGDMCIICGDDLEVGTEQLCRSNQCSGKVCRGCTEEYIKHSVEANSYMCTVIRCAACSERVPGSFWEPFASDDSKSKYLRNATTSLYFAQGGRSTWFVDDNAVQRFKPKQDDMVEELMAMAKDKDKDLVVALAAYHRGTTTADQFVSVLESSISPDHIIPKFRDIACLFLDIERRAGFQIAWLYKHPRMADGVCFKCKEPHDGQTCEQFNEEKYKDVEIKCCPRCGVATQKSFHCDHMVCVCGHEYKWTTLAAWGSS